ncbi:hypothetical protein ACHAWF_013279, partial [Thalassiosira exigua]
RLGTLDAQTVDRVGLAVVLARAPRSSGGHLHSSQGRVAPRPQAQAVRAGVVRLVAPRVRAAVLPRRDLLRRRRPIGIVVQARLGVEVRHGAVVRRGEHVRPQFRPIGDVLELRRRRLQVRPRLPDRHDLVDVHQVAVRLLQVGGVARLAPRSSGVDVPRGRQGDGVVAELLFEDVGDAPVLGEAVLLDEVAPRRVSEDADLDVPAGVVGAVPPRVLQEGEGDGAERVDALGEDGPHDLGVVQHLVEVAAEAVVARGLVLEPSARERGAVEVILDHPTDGGGDDLEVAVAAPLVPSLAHDVGSGDANVGGGGAVDAGDGGHLEGTLGEGVAREGMSEVGEGVGGDSQDVPELCSRGDVRRR